MEVTLQLDPENEWAWGSQGPNVAGVRWSCGIRVCKDRTSSCLPWPEQAIYVVGNGFYKRPKKD